jgi:hypothetical protein
MKKYIHDVHVDSVCENDPSLGLADSEKIKMIRNG